MTLFIWFLAGVAVGGIGALSMIGSLRGLGRGAAPRSAAAVIGGILFRLLLMAGALILALQWGALPALCLFAGWWLARSALLIWAGTGRVRWESPARRVDEDAD